MLVLSNNQQVKLSVQPVDAKGYPAAVDGVPSWSVVGANPEILTVDAADDGLSCECVTTGKLGTAQIKVEADADLGDGVTSLVGLLDVSVQSGPAVSLLIGAGAPEEIPAVEPPVVE